MRCVTRNQADKKIPTTPDHVALTHLRPFGKLALKSRKHCLFLAIQPDQGKKYNRPAKGRGIRLGMVATNNTLLLQPPYAPETGRGRNANTPGQFDIGHTTIILQLGYDTKINSVQIRHLIRPILCKMQLPEKSGEYMPRSPPCRKLLSQHLLNANAPVISFSPT